MRRLHAILAAVLLLGACANGGTSDDEPVSGIKGTVTMGPACPVAIAESPCPDVPWTGTVRATTIDGANGSEVTTDDAGSFQLDLAPGTYLVTPVIEGGGPPSAEPRKVAVGAGAYTKVALSVDSGIR